MTRLSRLESLLAEAELMGIHVRREWLDGVGGACRFGGKLWLFVDLSLPVDEQIAQASEALRWAAAAGRAATGDLSAGRQAGSATTPPNRVRADSSPEAVPAAGGAASSASSPRGERAA